LSFITPATGEVLAEILPAFEAIDAESEGLVVLICREIMGIGVTSFAPGRDGGKDAKFEGTASAFPSSAGPATGKFII
jgi:hypothetical protein